MDAVLDLGLMEALLQYGVATRLGIKWTEHPVLLVDNPLWGRETREALVQMFFTKFDVPALFLGRAPVLAAFAIGKHSALVIDCGESAVRVGPVYEGYLLRAGHLHQATLGGAALSDQTRLMLAQQAGLPTIHIPQQVAHKFAVELGQPAKFEPRMLEGATESFVQYHQRLVMDDLKEAVVQISELPYNETELSRRPPKYFEFPDGYNRNFVAERFRIGEQVFYPLEHRYLTPQKSATAADGGEEGKPAEDAAAAPVGLTEMIQKSLQLCDAEVRSSLMNNVILTGGGASMAGLAERLNYELGHLPSYVSCGGVGVDRISSVLSFR